MNFLHRQLDLQPEDVVEISLNSLANVLLLDLPNFSEYEQKSEYQYYGGHAETTPVRLSPPHAGRWHLVVDLGGYPGSVRADIRLLRHGKVLQEIAVKKPAGTTRQLSPVRIAPLEELNAYTVHEHELDLIAAGSPATLAFNFAIALISIGISFILTLTTTSIRSNRLFQSYLVVCINCLLAGLIAFVYWLKTRSSVNITVLKIKNRMVAPTPIQEQLPGETSLAETAP